MTWTNIDSKELMRKINENKNLYKNVKKLSKIETDRYRKQREKLIKGLALKGLRITQEGNSLFYGNLSEGCKLCKAGKWHCLYITEKCTRHCFFCTQPRFKPKRPDYPKMERNKDFAFKNSSELVAFLKKWKTRGVGISGGEPLFVLDRTLDFISAMRKKLGKNFYIWLYTNGDLASKETLRKLRDSGLNEIRFDLAARGYDISPLKTAIGIIDVVSVEIPAISEDEEKVKKLLPELKRLGVKHLNLHELLSSKHNLEDMKKRQYKVLIGSSKTDFMNDIMPIYGSELTALRIVNFAIDNNIGMPINFCSGYYKRHVQGPLIRKNSAEILKKPHETVTKSGYLEKIVISEPMEKANELVKTLKSKGVPSEKIYFCQKSSRLELHVDLLKYIDLEKLKTYLILARPCRIHEDSHDSYTKILS